MKKPKANGAPEGVRMVTCEEVVWFLKQYGRNQIYAADIAKQMNANPRSVIQALQRPVADGRVKAAPSRERPRRTLYTFVRLKKNFP